MLSRYEKIAKNHRGTHRLAGGFDSIPPDHGVYFFANNKPNSKFAKPVKQCSMRVAK